MLSEDQNHNSSNKL